MLVIGHVSTWWAFDHFVAGKMFEDLVVAPLEWQEGWHHKLDQRFADRRVNGVQEPVKEPGAAPEAVGSSFALAADRRLRRATSGQRCGDPTVRWRGPSGLL